MDMQLDCPGIVARREFRRSGLIWAARGTRPPRRYKVWGERCSGTNYVSALIGRNLALRKLSGLGAWKHGFPRLDRAQPDVLHVFVVRDPFDWARALHRKPWHAPHARWKLPIDAFLRMEWRSDWHDRGMSGIEKRADRHPVTGARFANIFEMRSVKLGYALLAWQMAPQAVFLRYEDAAQQPEAVIAGIAAANGLAPGKPFRPVESYKGLTLTRYKPQPYPDLSPEDRAFILASLDAPTERLLGYLPAPGA